MDVLTSASKVWRYFNRIEGKRTKVTIGNYPVIGATPLGEVHASNVLKLLEGMRNTPTKANNSRAVIERIYQSGAQKLLVTHIPATAMKGLIDKPQRRIARH